MFKHFVIDTIITITITIIIIIINIYCKIAISRQCLNFLGYSDWKRKKKTLALYNQLDLKSHLDYWRIKSNNINYKLCWSTDLT